MKTHALYQTKSGKVLQLIEQEGQYVVVVFDSNAIEPLVVAAYVTAHFDIANEKLSELICQEHGIKFPTTVDIEQAFIL